jgi:hypothetical protein
VIHATIHGVLLNDGRLRPACDLAGVKRQRQVRFTVSTTKHRGAEGEGQFQTVQCCIRGDYALHVAPHLVTGKRVVVSGELVMLTSESGESYLMLNVRATEFVGGTFTSVHEEA